VAPVRRRFDIMRRIKSLSTQTRRHSIGLAEASDVTGRISLYPDGSTPEEHLNCNGQAVSREDYSELFEEFGTGSPFGPGDGSTTFNVPNIGGAPAGFHYIIRV
jgi:hypothetical protein